MFLTRFNLDLLEPLALEKINLGIFYQNAPYREFLDETYFKSFDTKNLKRLILDLHSSEILMKIMEDFCKDELIEINRFKVSKHDLIMLKEKTAKFFIANILNLYKLKGEVFCSNNFLFALINFIVLSIDLENDLVHSNYIMRYQKEKLKQLQVENKSYEVQLQEEREKNAKLMKLLEKNAIKEAN